MPHLQRQNAHLAWYDPCVDKNRANGPLGPGATLQALLDNGTNLATKSKDHAKVGRWCAGCAIRGGLDPSWPPCSQGGGRPPGDRTIKEPMPLVIRDI